MIHHHYHHHHLPHPRLVLSPLPVLFLLASLTLLPCGGSGVPFAPRGLHASAIEPTSVTLRWVADRSAVEPATSYVVQYYELPSEPGGQQDRPMEETDIMRPFFIVQQLKPHTRYHFQVLGVNRMGRSPPSNALEIKTGELGWSLMRDC